MADDNTSGPIFKIDKSTLVPIGLLVSVVLSAISAVTWIQGSMADIRANQDKTALILTNELSLLKGKIEELKERMTSIATINVTIDDMQSWVATFRAENPTIKIPEIIKHR